MFASIIMKLIVNLISYYYSCSAYDCVSKPNIYSSCNLMNLKMYIKSQEILVGRRPNKTDLYFF